LSSATPEAFLPPPDGAKPATEQILPFALVRGTRGYIERVVNQINGCYERGWCDGCAVMMRRLAETLIIECFEKHKIADKIKDPKTGDFFYLSDLVTITLQEKTWNLTRNAKSALPRIRDVGNLSAHSRRYNAHPEDINQLKNDFRLVCQELLYIAGLK
jgi:hypothetical protein